MIYRSKNQSDEFTSSGPGRTMDSTDNPLKHFGLQVSSTGVATSWTVVLEASLDNLSWDTIMTHSKAQHASGKILWTGAINYPALYIRANVTELTLGAATKIKTKWLGMP